MGDIPGYVNVYSNAETDVGIYIDENYKATAPALGSKVTYLNSYGTVAEVYDSYFLVSPNDIEVVVPGVSGSIVYYEDTPIGFISGWNGNLLVRCVFF